MQVTTVGLDLAKDICQEHWIIADGTVAFNKSLRRAPLLQFFESLNARLFGMICTSLHRSDFIVKCPQMSCRKISFEPITTSLRGVSGCWVNFQ